MFCATVSPWRVCRGRRRFPWWCSWSRWSHSVSEGPLVGRIWLQRGAAGNSTATQNEAQDSGLEMLMLVLSLSRLWLHLSYLHNFSVAYVQWLSASTVQILHDQLKHRAVHGSVHSIVSLVCSQFTVLASCHICFCLMCVNPGRQIILFVFD